MRPWKSTFGKSLPRVCVVGVMVSTVLVLLAVGVGQVRAADFYVGGAGASDNNPGTVNAPFATIQKAAAVATAGDTVKIRDGIYRETVVPANSGAPDNWTVSESNHLDDRYAVAALLENAALELHIVPWPFNCPETPWGVDGALTPSIQEIYDSMPGLGPRVAPIAYRNGRPDKKEIEGKTFTCFGDYSVALHKIRENLLVNRHNFSTDRARSNRPGFLDVGAPMVLKNPSYAIATVMGAPRWDGTPDWTGSKNKEPGKWILNPDNPRKVTVWNRLHLKHTLVMADYWNTMRNPSIIQPRGK